MRPTPCILACVALLALGACGPSSKPSVAVVTPAELEPSGQRSELCSGANVVGVGLRGEYFAARHWTGVPLLTRVDPSIDFVGSFELPAEAAAPAPQSVRWSGWVKAPTNGKYRFHIQPAAARVVVARLDMQAGTASTGSGLEMVAGRYYPITVEIDNLKPAVDEPVRLEWTAPHGARYVIPRAVLNLPTETVATPAGS